MIVGIRIAPIRNDLLICRLMHSSPREVDVIRIKMPSAFVR
jgi:hypothetical protein